MVRGVDVTRFNWAEVLLGWIRRDVLCHGDKVTYDAARKASDGFEHGSLELPEYREAARVHGRAMLDYVRDGVLALLDLPEDVRAGLRSKRPLDVTPIWNEVNGVLTGNVEDPERLGEAGQPYPYLDWDTTLRDLRLMPDGRTQIVPRMTLIPHFADGVALSEMTHRLAVGLSDEDLYQVTPEGAPPADVAGEGGDSPTASADQDDAPGDL